MNKINWFPGHMLRATKNIENSLKKSDLIIEVVDARAINSSSISNELNFQKPILKLALKSDLADTKTIKDKSILIGSLLDKSFYNRIITEINKKLDEKKQKLIKRGLKNPTFYLMIIGLPNLGKSSLINFLARKKLVIAKNTAGVTKRQAIIKINENLFLEDNPGIFFKNVNEIDVGYKLSLINCIKKEILPLEDVCLFAYNFLKENYNNDLKKYFNFNENFSFEEFTIFVCQKNGFKLKNNIDDKNRFFDFFYNEIVNSRICKVNYEK